MKAEHRIGTVGGGMDQAAECLSQVHNHYLPMAVCRLEKLQSGSALHISFNPLRCESVSLPSHCIFVVADSMERKNKAASNDFNSRVVEGRISTAVR